MKFIKLLFTICFLGMFSFAQAQISESERSMVNGVKNAVILDIPDTDTKLVDKLWKDYMKEQGGKTKKVKKADEMLTESVRISDISGSSVNVYSRTESTGGGVEQMVWFDMGDDNYLSSGDGEAYQGAEKFMMGFGLFVTKTKIQMELDGEEKTMKGLEGDLKKLKKDNDSYHKQIEKAKELIAKMEANIEQNVVDQETKQNEILSQGEVIEVVKKKLKDLN